MQTMADLLKKTPDLHTNLKRGDVVEGTVVAVRDKYALIDVGTKSEGVLPSAEFKGQELLPHQKLWVYITIPEDREGQTILSLQKAAISKAWETIALALEKEGSLEVEVTGHNKGGLVVKILDLAGFIPFSHMINPPDLLWERPQLQSFLDKMRSTKMKVKVLELNEGDNRIILSEKEAGEDERLAQKQQALASFKIGDVSEAEIISILPYGLKVSVNGAEGLIPLEEIAWEQKEGILSDFSSGEKILAKVIEVDPNNHKLRLSLRQITKDPWDDLVEGLKKDKALEAEVVRVASFGVYVKVLGLEGMLALSEFGGEADVKIGERLRVKVASVDKNSHRLDLKLTT